MGIEIALVNLINYGTKVLIIWLRKSDAAPQASVLSQFPLLLKRAHFWILKAFFSFKAERSIRILVPKSPDYSMFRRRFKLFMAVESICTYSFQMLNVMIFYYIVEELPFLKASMICFIKTVNL